MIRVWLRRWLGISQIDAHLVLLRNEVAELKTQTGKTLWVMNDRLRGVEQQPTFADLSRKQFEIENALREAKEIREGAVKRAPVVTRSMREYRALMEQE